MQMGASQSQEQADLSSKDNLKADYRLGGHTQTPA